MTAPLHTRVIGRRLLLTGHFADPVDITQADDLGDVLILQVRTARGELKDATVTPAELETALQAAAAPAESTWADPQKLFLMVESARIRLAYAWDPYFAVSLSGIEPLPHQLEAVYERMLPQARLRFLLADDPGAGKTIMAGLLLKELKLRGAVERVLILAPAPLTLQWQDEMRLKFDEIFERVDSHIVRDSLAGSPWSRYPQCVASMDFAKMDHIAPGLLVERWDLIIIDEAHKVSMPDAEDPTMRFRLARALAERTERLLLLTATPHQGNPEQFRNLLSLLDEDVFRSRDSVANLLQQEKSPWIIRRMKEDLRDFEGKKLFVDRHVFTEEFKLNEHEWALYRAVTDYTNTYLSVQKGKRKQSAALARMVMQRRLSSSLRAIRTTLENRQKRLRELLDELLALPASQREKRLRELLGAQSRVTDPELDEDDETDAELDELAASALAADHLDRLEDEVDELDRLVLLARQTEERGADSKLNKLFACLDGAAFQELREHSGKLLIFTEHRATLDYLRRELQRRGYRCCMIHGGMPALDRKAAEKEFHQHAQVCIATEAAGEGINLQFCHLMINYDMPWNPNRLEQRMGRIHRFGQKVDCSVFNFVAVSGPGGETEHPVVEGMILKTLLRKLSEIRKDIGDRVFDVIGMLLSLHHLNLEEVLREATYNPRVLDDYDDQIQRLDPSRLQEYEKATGIALARRAVDFTRIRAWDRDSEEKRLMPGYVEDYFAAAAQATGLRFDRRANPALLRIEHVPLKFRARTLRSIARFGEPRTDYPKVSFRKTELAKIENRDGDLLSPGHALYAALDEVLNLEVRDALGGTARYFDPLTPAPYRLHFYETEAEGESLGDPGQPPRTVPVGARLVVVQESPEGVIEEASVDILHDLTPASAEAPFEAPAAFAPGVGPAERRRVEVWVRGRIQHRQIERLKAERAQEIEIRRAFLVQAFEAAVKAAQAKYIKLHARVLGGETDARLARDEAQKRLDELKAQREHRLKGLEHLRIVRSGRLAYLGSALVLPKPVEGGGLTNDPEVEHFAYEFATRYENSRGWTVEPVWKLCDGCGYDLRSDGPADPAAPDAARPFRRIEVKGRGTDSGEVPLTPNEWRKARLLRETYWLYVVWGCKTGRPRLKVIQDPWGKLESAAREITEVKGYWIDTGALEAAPGEEWRG